MNRDQDQPLQEQPMQFPSQEEILQAAAQHMGVEICAMLQAFTNLGESQQAEVANKLVAEQFEIIEKVFPTYTDQKSVLSHPTLIIRIMGPNGVTGEFKAPKSLHGIEDPGQGLAFALVLALLSSPQARALLVVNGFQYRFAQSQDSVTKKSKIII